MHRKMNPNLLVLSSVLLVVSANSFAQTKVVFSKSADIAIVNSTQKAPLDSVAESWHGEFDKILSKTADFDFDEVPLTDVLKELSEQYKIPFEWDKVAIEDAGFDSEMMITGSGKGRSLRGALDVMFDEYDFVCLHWNRSILLTTRDAITNQPQKYTYYVLYDVSDLIEEKPDDFVKVIQRTIRPQSWLDTNGGPASVSVVKTRNKIVLSIIQTSNGHYEVSSYLAALRKLTTPSREQ